MQATPQPTQTAASKTVAKQAKQAHPKSPQVEAKPVSVELEPHLEQLCDMATD